MKKSNVLIVEDDPDLRESWVMFFNNFGIDIYTATNGLEAKEIIDQYPMEVIVTDLQMPVKDGYFVLEYVKNKNINPQVWVCSGQLLTKKKLLSKEYVNKIITKPFDMLGAVQEIISMVNASKS